MTHIHPNQLSQTAQASVRELSDECLSTVTGGSMASQALALSERPVVAVNSGVKTHIPEQLRGDVCPIVPPDVFFSPEDLMGLSKF